MDGLFTLTRFTRGGKLYVQASLHTATARIGRGGLEYAQGEPLFSLELTSAEVGRLIGGLPTHCVVRERDGREIPHVEAGADFDERLVEAFQADVAHALASQKEKLNAFLAELNGRETFPRRERLHLVEKIIDAQRVLEGCGKFLLEAFLKNLQRIKEEG